MTRRLLLVPPLHVLVTLGALLAAVLGASLSALDPKLGIVFIGAVVYAPIAFISPPAALALWVPTAFLNGLPAFGAASHRSLFLLFVVWVGALAARERREQVALRERTWQLGLVGTFLLWMLLTLLWAPQPGFANDTIIHFIQAMLLFLIVLTFVQEPRHARWLAAGFVAGATLSVLAGVAMGGLDASSTTSTAVQGRLQGGTSDPNYLAAAIVPAIMLAGGLAARGGQPFIRFLLLVSTGVLAIGLAATESRGGFLSVAVVSILALVIWKGRRLMIASFIVMLITGAGMWFVISPTAWDRVTNADDGGSGRADIWQVAWRVGETHTFRGAGLSQFPVVSPFYLKRPGALSRADLIVNKRIVVHNAYLQLWAETGLIGLFLFLGIVGTGIAAGYRASKRFEADGDVELATLALAGMLALVGSLAASFFLSNLDDQRLWVLLAFGPALLAIAVRRGGEENTA